ncbi:hypothetical protein B0H11DRAFT_1905131 [Mycena galericulata]|nr:hypothetical protein B0H11DRAFT_1905131 [Mycena galericulata]
MNSLRSKAQHSPEICRSSLPVKSVEEVQQEGSRSTSNIRFILCDQDAEAKVLVQQQSAVSRNYHEDWERRKASYRIFEDTTTPAQLDSWPKSTHTLLVVTSLPMRVSDTPFFKSAPWRSLELRSGLGGAHQDQTLVPGGYWTSVQQFDETYFKSMGLGLGRQGVEEFLGISGPSIPQAETSPEASRALANVLLPFQLLDLILSWSEMKTRTSGSHPEIPPRSIDVLSPRCMKPIYDKLVKWPNILSTAIKCREKMVGKKKSGQKEVTPANPVKQFLAFAKRIGTNVRADASITNLEHASWLLSWMMLGHSRLPDLSELQDVLWSRANKLGLNLTKEELLGGLPMAIDVGKLSLALKFALQLTPVVLLLDVVLVKQSISVTEQHEVWRALGFKNTPILQAVEEVIMSGVCEMIREGITAEAALNSILSHEAIQTAMGLPRESPEYSRFGTANISYIPIGKDLLTRVLVLSQAQPPSLPGPQSPHVRSNPFDDGLLTFSPRTTPSSPLIDLHLVGRRIVAMKKERRAKTSNPPPPKLKNPENADPLQPASLSAEREIQIPSDHEWKLLDSVILSNKASLYLSGESDGSSSSAIVVLEPKEWLQEDSFRLLGKSHILVHSLMAAHDSLPLVIDTLPCMGNPMERVLVIEVVLRNLFDANGKIKDGLALLLPQTPVEQMEGLPFPPHLSRQQPTVKAWRVYSAHDFPTDQTRWFSIGTANTRCPAHVSHMATVLVVEDGVILLCISKPKPKPGRRFFVELLPEMTLVEQLDWEMVLLPAQSVFFLQPSTPYFYYNIQSSLVRGFGLFTVPNMLDSIFGVYRKCIAAPSELVLTLPRLSRIFSFWFVNLKLRDQGDPLSHFIDRHLPDLQRWEDFLTMISLGNVLLLADALDLRSYDSVGWESSQVECSERALSVDHVVGFRAWALERYRLTRRESAENNVLEWAFAVSGNALVSPFGTLTVSQESLLDAASRVSIGHRQALDSWTSESFTEELVFALKEYACKIKGGGQHLVREFKIRIATEVVLTDETDFIPLRLSPLHVSRISSSQKVGSVHIRLQRKLLMKQWSDYGWRISWWLRPQKQIGHAWAVSRRQLYMHSRMADVQGKTLKNPVSDGQTEGGTGGPTRTHNMWYQCLWAVIVALGGQERRFTKKSFKLRFEYTISSTN